MPSKRLDDTTAIGEMQFTRAEAAGTRLVQRVGEPGHVLADAADLTEALTARAEKRDPQFAPLPAGVR